MDSIRLRQVVQYIMFTFRFNNLEMVRPERFELPTLWFVAKYSIQLSYGRALSAYRTLLCPISIRCFLVP